MTKDEALQMCLEYIETDAHERRHVRWAIKEALAQEKALQALHDENERLGLYKDAYAKPESEPVRLQCVTCGTVYADEVPPQRTEQEPVAWLSTDSIGEHYLCFDKPLDNDPVQPLYTTPLQRTWVGLTDKQTTQVIKSMPRGIKGLMIDWDLYDFTRAIEAKLKKNT